MFNSNLFHKKDQNKVGVTISFIKNAEIGTAGDPIYWKDQNDKFLGMYFMEKAKIRYDWRFNMQLGIYWKG